MDAARPSTGGSRPTAGLSRKSSTKVTYAEDDIPAWTPEMEAELDNAKAALKAAHKKWSPEQEYWYPEVERLETVKHAHQKALRKTQTPSQSRRPSLSVAVVGGLFRSRTNSPSRPHSSADETSTPISGPPSANPFRRMSTFATKTKGKTTSARSSRHGSTTVSTAVTPQLSRAPTLANDNNDDDYDDDEEENKGIRRVRTGYSGKSEGEVDNNSNSTRRSSMMNRIGRGLGLGRRWS